MELTGLAMVPAIQIPAEQRPGLIRLLAMPPETADALLRALRADSPVLPIAAMAQRLAKAIGVSAEEIEDTLLLLAGMYLTRQSTKSTIEAFVEAVLMSARTMNELEHIEWPRVQRLLIDLLGCNSLGIAAKAAEVVYEHERLFSTARFLTDVRPIFSDDVARPPAAAVVVHTLCLTYVVPQHSEVTSAFYITLDQGDLKSLRDQIDRALVKEQSLRRLLANELPLLEVEEES